MQNRELDVFETVVVTDAYVSHNPYQGFVRIRVGLVELYVVRHYCPHRVSVGVPTHLGSKIWLGNQGPYFAFDQAIVFVLHTHFP